MATAGLSPWRPADGGAAAGMYERTSWSSSSPFHLSFALRVARALARSASVLSGCCFSGSWAADALRGGATRGGARGGGGRRGGGLGGGVGRPGGRQRHRAGGVGLGEEGEELGLVVCAGAGGGSGARAAIEAAMARAGSASRPRG